MNDYVVRDSGERQRFDTGAVRDTQEGKPRYDLISPLALHRIAMLMMRGAVKYGDRNWEKGMPQDRLLASAMRHLYAWINKPDDGEDHLAAVCFNVMAIMHFEELGEIRSVGQIGEDGTPLEPTGCYACAQGRRVGNCGCADMFTVEGTGTPEAVRRSRGGCAPTEVRDGDC